MCDNMSRIESSTAVKMTDLEKAVRRVEELAILIRDSRDSNIKNLDIAPIQEALRERQKKPKGSDLPSISEEVRSMK